MYGQRLDSLGNRLWGESGVQIFDEPYSDYAISADGAGGLLLAFDYEGDIKAQRLNSQGQTVWGDSGVWVCQYSSQQSWPKVTNDGSGGAYICWTDYRPPYQFPLGALFMQRLNASGTPQWATNGIMVQNFLDPMLYEMIPDGQGGIILHGGAGWENKARHINSSGTILWTVNNVSMFSTAKLAPGQPGYFYLGWQYQNNIYAQKMNVLNGFTYWPTLGSLTGAIMEATSLNTCSSNGFYYRHPYFYGVFKLGPDITYDNWMWAQKLDSVGIRQWGDEGVALSHFIGNGFYGSFYTNCAPDDSGGVVGVCQLQYSGQPGNYDIIAKRCNADGTLGGPVNPKPHFYPIPALDIAGTTVHYTLPEAGWFRLELYNLLGQKVGTLRGGYQPAGSYTAPIEISHLPSGIYLLKLTAQDQVQISKIPMIK